MPEYAEKTITVCFNHGLHLRPIRRVVTCVEQFRADVFFGHLGKKAPANSALELLALELLGHCELTISAIGADALEAVQTTCSLLQELEIESQEDI